MLYIRVVSNNMLDEIFKAITFLGDEVFLLIALPVIYFTRKRLGLKMALSVLVGVFVSHLLKPIFRVERPPEQYWKVEVSGYSFPSGHATNAATFWGYAAYTMRRKIYIAGILGLMVILIGYSRVYLRVHWWADVVAGWVIGLLIVAIVEYLDRKFGEQIDAIKFQFKLIIGFGVPFLVIGLSAAIIGANVPEFEAILKALSALSGIFTGHLIADKAGFSLNDTDNIVTIIIRSIICLIIVMIIYRLYKALVFLGVLIIIPVFWFFGIIVTLITPLIIRALHRE